MLNNNCCISFCCLVQYDTNKSNPIIVKPSKIAEASEAKVAATGSLVASFDTHFENVPIHCLKTY